MTPRAKLKAIKELTGSKGWAVLLDVMNDEILASAMSIAESANMDLTEITSDVALYGLLRGCSNYLYVCNQSWSLRLHCLIWTTETRIKVIMSNNLNKPPASAGRTEK